MVHADERELDVRMKRLHGPDEVREHGTRRVAQVPDPHERVVADSRLARALERDRPIPGDGLRLAIEDLARLRESHGMAVAVEQTYADLHSSAEM